MNSSPSQLADNLLPEGNANVKRNNFVDYFTGYTKGRWGVIERGTKSIRVYLAVKRGAYQIQNECLKCIFLDLLTGIFISRNTFHGVAFGEIYIEIFGEVFQTLILY
ncbi:hypothetical protein [Dyadobacter sp. 3J3]|uniref:hypothetical protein n=1 Tax=Dyadobacter sp. 3J3 TaxID=2606600 RepID=UPI001357A6A0|nr:hypothetical protein [Dyadobacter sp. 3J3]